jgi:hypothetical protein
MWGEQLHPAWCKLNLGTEQNSKVHGVIADQRPADGTIKTKTAVMHRQYTYFGTSTEICQ